MLKQLATSRSRSACVGVSSATLVTAPFTVRVLRVLMVMVLTAPVAFSQGAVAQGAAAQTVSGPAARLAEAVRFRTISSQEQAPENQASAGQAADQSAGQSTATQVPPTQAAGQSATHQATSANPNRAAFVGFNNFLRASYPEVFAALQVDVVNGHSLMLTWRGSQPDAGAILFTAHSDVVPIEPGTEGDWTHPPFAGVIADGMVHGRGTLDDKIGIISLLEAANALLGEGFRPRKTVVFAFGHDEEVGGRRGAAQLAKLMRQRQLHFDWMVDEGGFVLTGGPLLPERPLAMINVAEKGYVTLTLSAAGEGGHSSRPTPASTIARLSRALLRVQENPFPHKLQYPVDVMLEAVAPHIDQPLRFVFQNLWLTAPLVARRMVQDPLSAPLVRTTTALTMFNAGVKENVIPQRASAKVNFRLLPGYTAQQVVDYVTDVVDDPTITISYQRWDNVPPAASHTAQGYQVIAAAAAAVYPDAVVVPSLLIATTDTRHYIDVADNQYRFHGVQVPASAAAGIHGTNERVAVQSVENAVRVAKLMIGEGAK